MKAELRGTGLNTSTQQHNYVQLSQIQKLLHEIEDA